jgi:uncharacterized membrane protein YfcA
MLFIFSFIIFLLTSSSYSSSYSPTNIFNTKTIIILGIVFAILGGLNAKRKERSVLAWVILCFLFGIIALFILTFFLSKKDNSVSYYEPDKINENWVCTRCGANNVAGTFSCEECGQNK